MLDDQTEDIVITVSRQKIAHELIRLRQENAQMRQTGMNSTNTRASTNNNTRMLVTMNPPPAEQQQPTRSHHFGKQSSSVSLSTNKKSRGMHQALQMSSNATPNPTDRSSHGGLYDYKQHRGIQGMTGFSRKSNHSQVARTSHK